MSKIRKVVAIDVTSDTMVESLLGIDVPTGKVARINSVEITLQVVNQGANSGNIIGILAGMGVRETELATMNVVSVMNETDILGYSSLTKDIVAGDTVLRTLSDLTIGDSNHSIAPTVFVGLTATVSLGGTYNVLFDVDYDIVKLTTDIALAIATA